MAGMSISGLSSGLDTASIVNQLMQLEANPQNLLKQKLSKQNAVISALQGINTKVASLATAATALKGTDSLTAVKATSSNTDAVTATASATSTTTSVTFDVTEVAAAHSVLTDTITDPGDGSTPSFSLTVGGTTHTLSAASWSAADIAAAVNDAALGVTAAPVKISDTEYRVQVNADETGAASTFTLSSIGTITNSVLKSGTDATLTLGTSTIRSATNTFTDLTPGLSVTVKGKATGVTVTVDQDDTAATKKVKDLVTNLNTVLQDISYRTKAEADGKTGSAAVLVGDSLMRNLTSSLQDAAGGRVGTTAVSETGVGLDRAGAVTFDETKFTELLAADPAKAQEVISGLAERLATVADVASNSTTGTITQTITTNQGTVKDLEDRIESWDTRLEFRRAALERQYAALEVALSRNQSQSQWLAGALAGLPTYSS